MHEAEEPRWGNRLSVLIVDDLALQRQAIGRRLRSDFAIDSAASLELARKKLARRRYDVVILDLRLGDAHGSALLAAIPASTALVAMSAELTEGDLALLGNRADVILPKSELSLVRATVERALRRRRGIPDAVIARYADHFALAPTEREVATLAWRGHSDAEIVGITGLSRSALEAAWKRIFAKTGGRRRLLRALRRGWDPTTLCRAPATRARGKTRNHNDPHPEE